VRARLEHVVRAFAGEDAGAIADATTFHELGLDSFDMISLVLDVEATLRVRLPDQAIAGLTHFGALVEAVGGTRAKAPDWSAEDHADQVGAP
jgi:acyl carrier protein